MTGLRKPELLRTIADAVIDSGWNISYLSGLQSHPFHLQIYNNDEGYQLRVYIWTLTHGGGQARPADEYRIQITGVDRIEVTPGERTLVLGWWEPMNVFAGFDARRHSGHLGRSPSIQIRESCLREAYTSGFSPCDKGNQEIAIAFRPDFFVEYVENLETLHDFGRSPDAFAVLSSLPQEPVINDQAVQTLDSVRKTTVVSVSRKLRDNSFRQRVLTAYRHRCAVCGLQLKLVDAAHIVPVNYETSTDETSNGLALCALHHRAYDQALVAVDDTYSILVNEALVDEIKALKLAEGIDRFKRDLLPMILLPPATSDRPHVEYIKTANRIRGWSD